MYDQQRAAIPRASVEIECGSRRQLTTTNALGEFSVEAPPGSSCTVTARAPLFEAATTRVTLSGSIDVALVLSVRAVESEVTVTANRGIFESGFDVPRSVSSTTRTDIDSRPYQLLPQVLREEPGILLQQTTSAQTSPIIRGFTGQSNVYLLDGVRLNTSSWRSGPSQYFAWIDPAVVDRIDIVRGPGSVQYGSDALGGTIQVLTGAPSFVSSGVKVGGGVDASLGTAEQSGSGGASLSLQGASAAFRFGIGTRHVDDLRAGRGRDSHAAVTRFLGLPSSAIGDRLPETGYDQSGGFLTGSVRAGSRAIVNTLFIHQDQSAASRYDRIFGGDGLYRSGFDPQTLDFVSVKYRRLGTAGFDEVAATVSLNRQADGRFEQTRPTAVIDAQRAVTSSYGYQIEGHRRTGAHRFTLGAEIYDESISATREQTSPVTRAVQPLRPDIPDGTAYSSFGVFLQDVGQIVPGRVAWQGGLRYGRHAFSTAPHAAFGVIDEHVVTNAVTFQAGTVVTLTKHWHITFAASRGFRAANSSDLGAVGLSGGGGFEISPTTAAGYGGLAGTTGAADAVSTGRPVPSLGPEVAYAYEPGVKLQFDRLSVSVTGYDIEYLHAIQRRSIVFPANMVGTTISGYTIVRQDASGLAYIAQDVRPVATRVNVDRARILGFDAEGTYRIAAHWRTRAYYSLSSGRLSTGEYVRRMPPPMGGAALRWNTTDEGRWIESVLTLARAQHRLNPGDLSDARIGGLRTRTSIANYFNGTATDLGLVAGGVLLATGENLAAVQSRVLGGATSAPLFTSQAGFAVFGVRAGWRVTPTVDLIAIGENLTDRNYRLLGSGVDAPGANLQLRLRYRF